MPHGYPHGKKHWIEQGQKIRTAKVVKITAAAAHQSGSSNVSVINIQHANARGRTLNEKPVEWCRQIGVEMYNMNIQTFEREYHDYL